MNTKPNYELFPIIKANDGLAYSTVSDSKVTEVEAVKEAQLPAGWTKFAIGTLGANAMMLSLEIHPDEYHNATHILVSDMNYHLFLDADGSYSTVVNNTYETGTFDEVCNFMRWTLGVLTTHETPTLEEAKKFIEWCADYLGLGFHPDTDFKDYIDTRSGETMFHPDEATKANTQMAGAMNAFEEAGEDIYEYALQQL